MKNQRSASRIAALTLAGATAAGLAGAAIAQSQSDRSSTTYRADLQMLNNSGGSGEAIIRLSASGKNALVRIRASGLEAGTHLAHIHALSSGDSACPTLAQDSDNDGFIEVAEGAQTYGPIRVNFGNIDPDMDGNIDFQTTVKLSGDEGIMPLTNAHIVVHGRSITNNAGAGTDGEVDGSNGYKLPLPVLCGEIEATGNNAMRFRSVN